MMNWHDRLQTMILAGGLTVSGCGGDSPAVTDGGPDARRSSSDARDSAASAGDGSIEGGVGGADGGDAAAEWRPVIGCGNANPDPCICDRPKTSEEAKLLCDEKQACEALGQPWFIGITCHTDAGGAVGGNAGGDGGVDAAGDAAPDAT